MKKLVVSLIVIYVVGSPVAFSQVQPLTGNELPGAIGITTNTYTPEGLWNYNSSQAPVISEYGFTALLVQKFMVGMEDYKFEAYLMNSPEAAFGMYSTNILRCTIQDSVTSYDCLTQYQYQAAYGHYYIVITNQSGSSVAQNYSFTIMKKFMQLNPQTPMELPAVFNAPAFAKNRNQIDFISGMLGMQNSLMGWENLIVGVHFAMYAVILPDPRGEIYFAQISFPTQADLYNFLTRAKLIQNGVPIQAYNSNNFLFREFTPIDLSHPLTIYFLQCTQPVAIAEVTEE
ncbi:MAG: hypothetical protein HQ542_00070 [Bacteroidia bacterium]|nr:hypothetical protein [Bacteroidia bacterium]